MKQNISKEQVYKFGTTPDNFKKLGKLTRTDYKGEVNGLRLFDKLTLDTAIDSVIDDIMEYFNIGHLIEALCDIGFGFPRIGLTEARNKHEWITTSVLCLNGSKYHNKSFEADELCDALWDALVFMLNEQEVEKESDLIDEEDN
jgi:hypothetical protein